MASKKKKKQHNIELLSNWLGFLLLKLSYIKPNYIIEKSIHAESAKHHKARLKLSQLPNVKYRSYIGLAIILLIISFAYSSLNFRNFKLDDRLISTNQSSSEILKKVTNLTNNYKLIIKYPNGSSKKYPLNQLGLTINKTQTLVNIQKQDNNLESKLLWWKPIDINVAFNQNKNSFNSFIESATRIIVEPAVDATLSINSGQVKVSNAVTGKEYGLTNSSTNILDIASSLSPQAIKLKTLANNPAITEELLQPYKIQLQKVLTQPISFVIGVKTITPNPSTIASWLDISPNDKTKSLAITVNSGKVLSYIDNISAPYIHPPKAQVSMVASDGSSQILVPGINGSGVSGDSSIATSISNNLLSGKGINESLSVSYKPFQTITAGDYPKWIEVDLTNKRLYAYQHADLINTYLVTAGAPKTPTVTGQYAIYTKHISQNMTGENVDGSTYFQPNVPWVNYFYGGYAIHGNYWRPISYFGNVNSSHGCVGMMDGDAEWVYNWAPIGTPVIIHY
ncbi:MAG TPA: L,D-transpeptidase family protein [Patescibacteria group bacterium]|nr:L,D-transpeptidase family protein [Patescibacteria group bacterium]